MKRVVIMVAVLCILLLYIWFDSTTIEPFEGVIIDTDGSHGAIGETGKRGRSGPVGPSGQTGPSGPVGSNGHIGSRGPSWLNSIRTKYIKDIPKSINETSKNSDVLKIWHGSDLNKEIDKYINSNLSEKSELYLFLKKHVDEFILTKIQDKLSQYNNVSDEYFKNINVNITLLNNIIKPYILTDTANNTYLTKHKANIDYALQSR